MARLGPLRQLGLVVEDIDAAISHWTDTMGVGPFMLLRNRIFADYEYRGRAAPPPDVSIAIAFSGALQIELIQQHNAVPSAYMEYLAAGAKGPQHLCAWYSNTKSFDAAYEDLEKKGLVLVHRGRSRGVNVRFAYFESATQSKGPQIEISEGLLPGSQAIFTALERECATWDGTLRCRELIVGEDGHMRHVIRNV